MVTFSIVLIALNETQCLLLDMEVGFAATEYVADGASGHVAVCVEVLNPPSGGAIQPFIVALLPEKGLIYKVNHCYYITNTYLSSPQSL